MAQTLVRRIVAATAIAGTLDIILASVQTLMAAKTVAHMLRAVASGPVPKATEWGAAGAALGLVVHYAIMAVMAAVFMFAYSRIGWMRAHSLLGGVLYGLGLWLVMNGIVLPLRFGLSFPSLTAAGTWAQIFSHMVLVGLTFGLIARSGTGSPRG